MIIARTRDKAEFQMDDYGEGVQPETQFAYKIAYKPLDKLVKE